MRLIIHWKRSCKRVVRFYFEGKVRKCWRCCGLHGVRQEHRSLSAFLSVTSWKSRSVRLLLEVCPGPNPSSFDFNQTKKNKTTHFLLGVNLWGMSSRVSLLWLFFSGGERESQCPGANRAERLPPSVREPPLTDHLPEENELTPACCLRNNTSATR